MNFKSVEFPRRIRSYVRRDGRMTEAQRLAYEENLPQFGLAIENNKIDLEKTFARNAPTILEIGFGSGQSLLAMAIEHPEYNCIGVETYLPGIGAVLLGMQRRKINNIRLYHADAVEVLEKCIPENSLACIQIFFPDPWPKRKHHKRRLIQLEFIELVASRLMSDGILHLATDWEHYAEHMMKVLSSSTSIINLVGENQFADRSEHRPIITKFEQRGIKHGRKIWELQFAKNKVTS